MDLFNRKLVKRLNNQLDMLKTKYHTVKEQKAWLVDQEQRWKNKYEHAMDTIVMMDDEIEQIAKQKYLGCVVRFTVENVDEVPITGVSCGDTVKAEISSVEAFRGVIYFRSRNFSVESDMFDDIETDENNAIVLKATLSHANRILTYEIKNIH